VFSHLPYKKDDFPISERAAARVISLPMHPYLTEETQRKIVRAVAEAIAG